MMSEAMQAIRFDQPRSVTEEDQVRADFYALLANLFYHSPDDDLLQAIVIAPEPDAENDRSLADAWIALAAASGVVTADAVADEFDSLFGGLGRAQVMPYASYYQAGFLNEKPLAELRSDLARLGFSRLEAVRETEDHLAALCDVMRAMILGDIESPPAALDVQKLFFMKHIQPWILLCCDATINNPNSNYYKRVAAFANRFFQIEIEAFEMQSS
jgi:TorA maturation chaperone TorD